MKIGIGSAFPCCMYLPIISYVNTGISCHLLLLLSYETLTIHSSINRARTAAPSRTMAVESRAHLYKDIPTNWDQLKNNIWLSDAGALPVIFVLTFACGLSATFIGYNCVANPDVRITTSKRQQLIRTWE